MKNNIYQTKTQTQTAIPTKIISGSFEQKKLNKETGAWESVGYVKQTREIAVDSPSFSTYKDREVLKSAKPVPFKWDGKMWWRPYIPTPKSFVVSAPDLYPHQKLALKQLRDEKPYGIWPWGLGAGKTRPIIAWADNLPENCGGIVLVICPKMVIRTWIKEHEKWSIGTSDLYIPPTKNSVSGTADMLNNLYSLTSRNALVVINYDIFHAPEVSKCLQKLADIQKISLIAYDESHYLKSRKTKRIKQVWKLCEATPFRVVMSGTMLGNSPEDLWTQVRAVGCDAIPRRYQEFESRYGDLSYDGYSTVWTRRSLLYKDLSHHVLSVRTSDIVELPPIFFDIKVGNLTEEELKEYNSIDTEFTIADLSQKYCIAATAEERVEFIKDLIISTDEPMVIFFQHTALREKLQDYLTDKQITHIILDGSNKPTPYMLDAWEKGDVRICLAQYQSASAGANWQHCHYTVLAEPSWSYINHDQAIGRTHRPGQQNKVIVYQIVIDNSLDPKIVGAVNNKEDFNLEYLRKTKI